MKTFQVAVKTDTTNKDSVNGVIYFLMHSESAEEIWETLGTDIDVAKFLTWYGAVDLSTGKLINDRSDIPKRLGKITEMKILNIKDCEDSTVPCNAFFDIRDIREYDEMCRKYDFDLDKIYDIDYMNSSC